MITPGQNVERQTEERLATLPKWAQAHMRLVHMRLDEALKRLGELEHPNRDACTVHIGGGMSPIAHFANKTVLFGMYRHEDGTKWADERGSFTVDYDVLNDTLTVRNNKHASRSRLAVIPHVSNEIQVRRVK